MPTARQVTVDGVRLCVEERGRGTPVALLHGFAGSSRDLEALARSLGATHRVLAIDLVGHGRSDAPHAVGPYAMERCIAQVAGVLEATGAAPAHLFGYSMGGRVALGVAVRRPESIRSLALLGASAGLADVSLRAERRRSDEELAARIESEGVRSFVRFWSGLPLFATQRARLSPDARRHLHTRRLANRAHGLANSLRGMGTGAQPPFHAALEALDLPVWLGYGADDGKFAGIARDLSRRLHRSELSAIPAAGHAAHLENPTAVCEELRGFFARAERRGRPSRVSGHAAQPSPNREAEPAGLRPDPGVSR